jgi:hypothetical protein
MRLAEVRPQPNGLLPIVAGDGRIGSFDVSPYLGYGAFKDLRDHGDCPTPGARGFGKAGGGLPAMGCDLALGVGLLAKLGPYPRGAGAGGLGVGTVA